MPSPSNNNHMPRNSNSLPALVSFNPNVNSESNYNGTTLSLPPPLESPELHESNKENMAPIAISSPRTTRARAHNKTNRRAIYKKRGQKRKSAFDDAVPPLELLVDPCDDLMNKSEERKEIVTNTELIHDITADTQEPSVINEECQESGCVSVTTSNDHNNNNNNSQTTQNNPNTANSNTNDPLSTASYMVTSNGRLLASEQDWYRRPKVTHSGTDNGEMSFRPLRMKCTHCDEAYTKTHDLYAHIRTHQNHTKCPHCGKILTCMATFVYHVRTHTAEKPYYCPCDGCDFKNAVKYNLKVHLACIRHGGKENLKKYAKVLDLDVCEKSLRKRKDNSVHELGSRRSKRRRKMNMNLNTEHIVDSSMSSSQPMSQHTQMSHYYPKQEECDQFTAQLLFSLSGIPPVFDQNMSMNQAAMMDWSSIIGGQPAANVIKSEQQNLIANGASLIDPVAVGSLKPEQYYDPLYGYYGFAPNTNSLSTSTIWGSDEHAKIEMQQQQNNHNNHNNNSNRNDGAIANSDALLIPKQEPIYPIPGPGPHGGAHAEYTHGAYLNAAASSAQYQQQMQQHAMLTAGNLYYGNGYYFNYGSECPQYSTTNNANMNQMGAMPMQQNHINQQNDNKENDNKFELPPLQF